jgi:hypothetical protein
MRRLARKAWEPDIKDYTKCKPDPDTVLEVLKVALAYQEYDLYNTILGWIRTDAVPTLAFGLVKPLALAGRVDVSKIKTRFVHNHLDHFIHTG